MTSGKAERQEPQKQKPRWCLLSPSRIWHSGILCRTEVDVYLVFLLVSQSALWVVGWVAKMNAFIATLIELQNLAGSFQGELEYKTASRCVDLNSMLTANTTCAMAQIPSTTLSL